MTGREKIILGLTAVAAIGGGLHFVLTSAASDRASSQVERRDFSELITEVQETLRPSELTPREEYALATVSTQWLRDPLRPQPLRSTSNGATVEIPLPAYTGFINTGPRPIAIINGRDYRAGESIQGEEFQLIAIHPDAVELRRRGASDPVRVPLGQPAGILRVR